LLFLKDLNIDLSSYITLAEDQIINEW
jgi:hypothetical protein